MLGYLSVISDIICSEKWTVSVSMIIIVISKIKIYEGKQMNWTELSFEEQIMSKDKYPRLFSCQMECYFWWAEKQRAHFLLKEFENILNK